ncbi:MAG: aminoglycoside phosphotransferase family protein [Acidimicrobiales bacterium]|nr:aminoglycoside phosphotransferase family protein [Acidimicrobiales bacterium]
MHIDDPHLPAARELYGDAAIDVLRPAVTAAGGTIHHATCTEVHYLPGREMVARYDCDVTWPTGRTSEVLLAAATPGAPLPGTVAVTAATPTSVLDACVWRWPFDPVVTGLPVATTPAELTRRLDGVVAGPLQVEVVAYHPTRRAVARVTDARGRISYLKALPPSEVAGVAARHDALRAAGLRVPEVLHVDTNEGLLLLSAMPGATLRDHIRSGRDRWPDAESFTDLFRRLGAVAPGGPVTSGRAPRTHDALAHVAFLVSVAPDLAGRLAPLGSRFEDAREQVGRRRGPVVHGDLHEAQLFVDDTGTLTGIIDLDDLGPGDPLDDPAVLLGHLEYRALTSGDEIAARLRPHIDELGARFAAIHGTEALDVTVAAVLVGLATGPFRSRIRGWRELTDAVLAVAERRAGLDRMFPAISGAV